MYYDLAYNAQVTPQGWLFYSEDEMTRTLERRVTDLKISDELQLPTYEISAGYSRLRRRVTLPPALIPAGEPLYHFLQYKLAPIVGGPARSSLLAGLAHGDKQEEDAINARAARFAENAALVGRDMDPEEWAVYLANLAAVENFAQFEANLNEYRSDEDEDYVPGSDDEAALEGDAEYEAEDGDDLGDAEDGDDHGDADGVGGEDVVGVEDVCGK